MADHDATIAQTLPFITQSATGETDYWIIEDAALLLSNTVSFDYLATVSSTATAKERIRYAEDWPVTQYFTATNTVEYYSQINVDTPFYATNTLQMASWTTQLDSGHTRITNRTSQSVTFPVTTTFYATDSQELFVGLISTQYMTATNTATASQTLLVEHQSTLLARNVAEAGQGETVISVLNATNSIPSMVVASNQEVASEFYGTNTTTATKSTFEELLSTFTGTELITFDGSIANNTVDDTFYAKNAIWAKDFGALAWVLNTETGGLSTYTNYGFNSLAAYNGVLYATSNDGVFEIASDTDADSRFIAAEIKTGFLDFKQENTKRISDIFLGHVGGQLEFAVETYDGPQEVYTYAVEEREIDAPRNNRLKVGRGLSSRYWRFAIQNVDGADFQIYDVTAEVASSKRRL